MQIHLFSGLGSSLLPSLRRGTEALEGLIDKLGIADAEHHIWNDWQEVGMSIRHDGGPVILLGHSNGLIACAGIAKMLQARGITVHYVGAIDPTVASFPAFGANTLKVQEFWASSGWPWFVRMFPIFGQGKCLFDVSFRGEHRLYHINGSHVGVASNEHVHSTILASIKEIIG